MRESAGRNRLLTIFLIVFVDLLGFSLILPLLPYYAEQYGASEVTVGLLTASYAAAQLVGAPLLGRLSDQYGRRPILLVSIAGTILGFVLLALAEPLGQSLGGAFFGANTGGDQYRGAHAALCQPHSGRADGRQHLGGAGLHRRYFDAGEPQPARWAWWAPPLGWALSSARRWAGC